MNGSSDLEIVKANVGCHPDFPKPGIIFRDLLPVFENTKSLTALTNLLVNYVKSLPEVQVIVGLEARGFLLAPIIATNCNIPLQVVRKKGKLPGKTKSVTYSLEYGEDTFEMQDSGVCMGKKVLLVDDLLATGGTATAAYELVKQLGGDPVQLLVVIELPDLNGRKKVPCPVHSFLTY